jgi:6-phosphogluconolactonase
MRYFNINKGGNMNKQGKGIVVFVTFLMVATLGAATFGRGQARHRSLRAGAVYVLTNQVNNAVAVFRRGVDGTLLAEGQFSTGGAGDPVAQPPDPPVDPLASQGALVLGPGGQFLFAVNAGSNQISVFRVWRGGLHLADVVASGGVRPISLTVYETCCTY